MKWSRSVDSPTFDDNGDDDDESGNIKISSDRSNHRKGRTALLLDDQSLLKSNKNIKDNNKIIGKEALSQVGWQNILSLPIFSIYDHQGLKYCILFILIILI